MLDYLKKIFEIGQKPSSWLAMADMHKRAADALLEHELPKQEALFFYPADKDYTHEDFPNFRPIQLLYGYALENLLKGIVIARNPSLAHPEKLDGKISHHRLFEFADELNFSLTDEEKRILFFLSEGVIWSNKYPSPLKFEKSIPNPTGNKYDPCGISWSTGYAVISSLYIKFEAELRKLSS